MIVKKIRFLLLFFLGLTILTSNHFLISTKTKPGGAPPYGESKNDVPLLDNFSWLNTWQRPKGPVKVALQVGHWKNNELPDELDHLRGNTGASYGKITETEINLKIAQLVALILEKENIQIEILPATIPPSYWADSFIAIHTDGSLNPKKSGFKIATPWRDLTKKAKNLAQSIEKTYQKETKLTLDPNITDNMRGYYAFSWWKNKHALHPMTPAVIIETGFLTNYHDRRILTQNTDQIAQGITKGLTTYLKQENLL